MTYLLQKADSMMKQYNADRKEFLEQCKIGHSYRQLLPGRQVAR